MGRIFLDIETNINFNMRLFIVFCLTMRYIIFKMFTLTLKDFFKTLVNFARSFIVPVLEMVHEVKSFLKQSQLSFISGNKVCASRRLFRFQFNLH